MYLSWSSRTAALFPKPNGSYFYLLSNKFVSRIRDPTALSTEETSWNMLRYGPSRSKAHSSAYLSISSVACFTRIVTLQIWSSWSFRVFYISPYLVRWWESRLLDAWSCNFSDYAKAMTRRFAWRDWRDRRQFWDGDQGILCNFCHETYSCSDLRVDENS